MLFWCFSLWKLRNHPFYIFIGTFPRKQPPSTTHVWLSKWWRRGGGSRGRSRMKLGIYEDNFQIVDFNVGTHVYTPDLDDVCSLNFALGHWSYWSTVVNSICLLVSERLKPWIAVYLPILFIFILTRLGPQTIAMLTYDLADVWV